MPAFAEHPRGVAIDVVVQPRSSRNEIVSSDSDVLRVRLSAPPVHGAANAALIQSLADALDVGRGRVTILRGERGRRKTVLVDGLSPAEARVRLNLGHR